MIVHNRYPEKETRVERQALALRQAGSEVDVICLRGENDAAQETVNGVRIFRLPARHRKGANPVVQLFEYLHFFVLAFFQLNRLYREAPYGVVQVHNLPDFLAFVAVWVKWQGARVILDLHDLMPEFYAERMNQPLNSLPVRLIKLQERLSCNFADHVITVTELWRQTLIQRGQPAEKVSVVMNVADDKVFNRQAAGSANGDAPNKLDPLGSSATNAEFHLIYHGTMAYRYGLDLLLQAFARVCSSSSAVHLTLHGTGEYQPALVQLAKDLGLNGHVTFSTRSLSTSELPQLIKTAHMAVVPYRSGVFTDGILPTKMMEYAALGVPVIAARTPGIAAYFDETMVSFFTPGSVDELAACIQRLLHQRETLAQMANQLARFTEEHSWQQESRHYVQLVQRLGGVAAKC
jgi:glycosyltransferase involved in cell wall biosynthesis